MKIWFQNYRAKEARAGIVSRKPRKNGVAAHEIIDQNNATGLLNVMPQVQSSYTLNNISNAAGTAPNVGAEYIIPDSNIIEVEQEDEVISGSEIQNSSLTSVSGIQNSSNHSSMIDTEIIELVDDESTNNDPVIQENSNYNDTNRIASGSLLDNNPNATGSLLENNPNAKIIKDLKGTMINMATIIQKIEASGFASQIGILSISFG